MAPRRSMGRIATFVETEFPASLVAKRKGQHRVSVCIPARDEEATVDGIVTAVRTDLVERLRIVDELVVVDDGSLDGTAVAAAAAGARVVASVPRTSDGVARSLGKGGAMRRGLEETAGDLVVFLDADVTSFLPSFVTGLLGPLLVDAGIALVKGCYTRPIAGAATGGGRVTELAARPALGLLFPDLAPVLQPLAGETAARRSALDLVGLDDGYGVEIGLLIDVAERLGAEAIAQVDLGMRAHRNRPLEELAPQAREVLAAVLARAGVGVHGHATRERTLYPGVTGPAA